jgi:SAM-dependent methyltransferase
MTRDLLCRMKPYIQPFERTLALEELAALTGSTPRPARGEQPPTSYRVATTVRPATLAGALSYWEQVDNDPVLVTRQVLREATVSIVRNGIPLDKLRAAMPLGLDAQLPNRRCLRYASHGLHEYRGKFFPQLVRSLINIARVPSRGLIADPMCGSGTTLVETVLTGRRAVGADINPLSVELARTKCLVLTANPARLCADYERLRDHLLRNTPRDRGRLLSYFSTLPEPDQRYLQSWFANHVLADLDDIITSIRRVKSPTSRALFRLVFSNIIRRVSWQKDDDLRVRKEIRTDIELDAVAAFLEELGRSVRILLAFLYQDQTPRGRFQVVEADARTISATWNRQRGNVDVVIMSPPYATGLPYIDTDRLSLSYLGLLSRPAHRHRDVAMVGNREISDRLRNEYWKRFHLERNRLPDDVARLLVHIEELNQHESSGFRRKNVAALLTKYFLDMRLILEQTKKLLKRGARAYFVVGSNHTVAGGEHVDIDTARHLRQLAQLVGFKAGDHLTMEMLVSRDIFRKNASNAETILEFINP